MRRILLVTLRLLQGLAVGGEVGGAVLLVAESMNRERRGFWTAWPQIGGPAGNLAAAAVLAALAALLTEADFADYGWRVAFLLSGGLIAIGVWMRSHVEESPLYRAHVARRAERRAASVWRSLRKHARAVLSVLLVKAGENALFYVFTTFFVVYVTRVLHLPRTLALTASLLGSAVEVVTIFWAGALSDRLGRRPVTAFGLVGAAAWSFLMFPITDTGTPGLIALAAAVGGAFHGFIVGGMSAFFVELFPTRVRYSGFSLGYQFASVISGAVAPIIGVALLDRFASTVPVSLYACAMAVPALVCLWVSKETKGIDLSA